MADVPAPEHDGEPAADRRTPPSLLGGLRQRHPEAVRRLVLLYQPLLLHWCSQLDVFGVGPEDLVQDVLTVVVRKVTEFKVKGPGSFRAWLRGVAQGKLRSHDRRIQPRAVGQGTAGTGHGEGAPGEDDDPPDKVAEVYHRALHLIRNEFLPDQITAFVQYYCDGRPWADMAGELRSSTGALRAAVARIRRRILEVVGDVDPEAEGPSVNDDDAPHS